jgi:FAD:protein FMN transferase
MKFLKKIFFLVTIATVLFSCNKTIPKISFMGEAQGTYYSVTYFDQQNRNFQDDIDSILQAFDQSVSIWVPTSIISRINNNDTSVEVDPWFRDIFNLSEQISAKTDGAFDITVGPLVNAWGFGFKDREKLDPHKVDSLKQYVDYKDVKLVGKKIVKDFPQTQFDFNAIAQGYSVDVVAKFLESKGVYNYLVDIGGEVLGHGTKPNGDPWVVGVENPTANSEDASTINTKVSLLNQAIATSGSYRKYYEENGIRYSHTIDPKTGYPVTHNLLSVSVLARDCATADGYATAFMVMGVEKSEEFVKNDPDLEAYFIYSAPDGSYKTYATEGFRKIMKEN